MEQRAVASPLRPLIIFPLFSGRLFSLLACLIICETRTRVNARLQGSATREKSNNAPFHAATQSAVCRYIDCAIVQGDELSANATMDTFSEIFRGLRGGTNERTKNTARARVSAKFHASLMKKSATSGQKMPPQKCETLALACLLSREFHASLVKKSATSVRKCRRKNAKKKKCWKVEKRRSGWSDFVVDKARDLLAPTPTMQKSKMQKMHKMHSGRTKV